MSAPCHLGRGAGSEVGDSGLQDGKLYWCDARTDKIERIDLETGEDREVVLSSNNMDMFSVSVFEEFIYWSDRWASVLAFPWAIVPSCSAPADNLLMAPRLPTGLMPTAPSSAGARTMPPTQCPCEQASVSSSKTSKSSTGTGRKARLGLWAGQERAWGRS